MVTKKKTKVVLDLEKKVADLEVVVKQKNDNVTYWQKLSNEKDEVINSIHDILTDLGIREFRDDNKYAKIPLSVRLFSWAMSLVNEKVKTKTE